MINLLSLNIVVQKFNCAVAASPTNVAANRSSDTEVTVSWDAPSPVPDGYEVLF